MTAIAKSIATHKPRRKKNGQLLPGETANPFGPHGRRYALIEHWARELIEDPLGGHKVLKRLLEIIENSPNEIAVCQAAKLVMEYAYGKPRQRLELAGQDGKPLNQVIIIGTQRIEF